MGGTSRCRLDLQIVTRILEQLANRCLMWRWAFAHAVPAEDARVGNPRHIICSFTQWETDLSTTPNLGVPSS